MLELSLGIVGIAKGLLDNFCDASGGHIPIVVVVGVDRDSFAIKLGDNAELPHAVVYEKDAVADRKISQAFGLFDAAEGM